MGQYFSVSVEKHISVKILLHPLETLGWVNVKYIIMQ